MSEQNNIQQITSDTQQVLVDYLDQLLNESPVQAQTIAEADVQVETPVEASPETSVAEVAPAVEEPVITEVEPVITRQEPVSSPSIDEPVMEEKQAEEVAEEVIVEGAPEWAQQPSFQVLLFKVSGITLAVPLDSLNGILEWNEENISEMPGHAEYFLGLLPERDRQIKLVDTASIVVPAKFRANHSRRNLQKIILIGEGEWGLACDGVEEVVTLTPTDVRWRSSKGLRPWLAGTVIEQMCALLNTREFADLLASEQLEMAD